MEKFFKFKELGTDTKTEIIAGLTTFFTMSYIIIVNPKVLGAAGIPYEASITATILAAFVGCMLIGLYANKPFAIAPFVGEAAFASYTVVLTLGFRWQNVFAAMFISGLIFFILTLLKVRPWLANSLPKTMKLAFTSGLGLFIIFIGLRETGIVVFTKNAIPLSVGDFHNPTVLLSLFGLILTAVLMYKKTKGAILIGIVTTTILGFFFADLSLPTSIISMPPSLTPLLFKLDFSGIFTLKFLPIFFIIFLLIYIDTMGCLIGLFYKANLLDKDGNIPDIQKPMLCDSLATMAAAGMGTVTSGVYLESVTGIESGGKSGFTTIITGLLFLLALFFSPVFTMIPPYAYAPAIILVGMLMLSLIGQINFDDMTEYVPALLIIATMSFTNNIGIGMTLGFIVYPTIKVLTGRKSETNIAMWILAVLSIGFFLVYPY